MNRLGATLSPSQVNAARLPFAVADQRVITGQNSASGGTAADLVLHQLATRP